MSTFRSPYDREFELQAQEEHKAYQRGFNAGQKSVLDKIRVEILLRDKNVKDVRTDGHCFFTADEIFEIIDKYKEGEEK